MARPVYNYESNKFMFCIKTNKLAGLVVSPSTSTPEVVGSILIFNDFSAYMLSSSWDNCAGRAMPRTDLSTCGLSRHRAVSCLVRHRLCLNGLMPSSPNALLYIFLLCFDIKRLASMS
jgi:hypothetical protein